MFLLSIIGIVYLTCIAVSIIASSMVIILTYFIMDRYEEVLDQIKISKMIIKYSFLWPFTSGPFIYKRIKKIKELRITYYKGNK